MGEKRRTINSLYRNKKGKGREGKERLIQTLILETLPPLSYRLHRQNSCSTSSKLSKNDAYKNTAVRNHGDSFDSTKDLKNDEEPGIKTESITFKVALYIKFQ